MYSNWGIITLKKLIMDSFQLPNILFTSSTLLASEMERDFNYQSTVAFARSNTMIPIGMIGVYLIFCFGGEKIMASRKAFDLRIPLACWNALLCTFSFIGMCRTVSKIISHKKTIVSLVPLSS